MLASSLFWLNFLVLRIPISNILVFLPCMKLLEIVRTHYLSSYSLLRGTHPVLGSIWKLMQSEPKLVPAFFQLMDNSSPKFQCKALIALKYLTEYRES